MKVLLTGATGFIGGRLLNELPHHKTVVLGRTSPSALFKGRFIKSQIGSNIDYLEALKGVDVVIHLAARVHVMQDEIENPLKVYRETNTYATTNLAKQAAEAGVKRFIFISSIKVNGENTNSGRPFTSFDMRKPSGFYAQSKAEAEISLLDIAKSTGIEVVIIRPSLVYGSGVKANFASLFQLVDKGIPLPFACIKKNYRSLVSVKNLVDLILKCINHPKASNQVFLVSDDNDLSTSDIVFQMAKALGKFNLQVPVPILFYKIVGKVFNKGDVVDRLIGSLHVDISHTKNTLDWAPPQTIEDGFKETQKFLYRKRVCK